MIYFIFLIICISLVIWITTLYRQHSWEKCDCCLIKENNQTVSQKTVHFCNWPSATKAILCDNDTDCPKAQSCKDTKCPWTGLCSNDYMKKIKSEWKAYKC